MKNGQIALVVFLLAGLFLCYNTLFVVDETEQVVVTRFGKVVRPPIATPGLNIKMPFIDVANYFPKNLLQWNGSPGQIPTKDKTFIWVDSFARWRIVDPVAFFQTVSTLPSAIARLDDIIDPAVRNFVTSYPLIESVRKSNRELDTIRKGESLEVEIGSEKMVKQIVSQAQPKLEKFGIELMDVKFKRINYVQEVRNSIYLRMTAERDQMAEKFRSEGQGEANKIRGDKERELKRISSEAYRAVQVVKGKADAEALAIYAEAYQLAPEFYSFVKTLEVYESSLDKSSSLVLSTDSEFLKYLKKY